MIPISQIDFQAAFKSTPGNSILLLPDSPDFTIAAANEGYCNVIGFPESELIGKGVFKAFPANENDPADNGATALAESLAIVLAQKKIHHLSFRYDTLKNDGGYAERYWRVSNKPIVNDTGTLLYILNATEEVTAEVLAKKRAEEMEGVAEVHDILMQAPVAIYILKGPELTIAMANDPAIKIWGKDRSAIGKPFSEVFPSPDLMAHTNILHEVIAKSEARYGYREPISFKKEQGLYNFVFQPYYEKDKTRPAGVLAFVNDITERMDAVEALEVSEALFQQIANTLPLVVWTAAPDGGLTYISDQWENFYGNPISESLGMGWVNFVHPADVPDAGKEWAHSLATGENYETEFRVLHKNGTHHWVLVRAVALRDEAGTIISWYGSNTDIQDKKLSEQIVEESEERFRNLADQVPQFIWMVTGNDISVTYANKNFLNFLGMATVDEFTGHVWESFMHPEDVAEVQEIYEKAFALQQPYSVECRFREASSGEYRWILITGVPRKDVNDEFSGFIGTGMDITDRRKAEDDLKQTELHVRSIVESAPFPIGVYTGKEMRITLANKSIIDVWKKGTDVVGKLYSEILPELHNQAIFDQLDEVYTTGVSFHAKNQRVDLEVGGEMQPFWFNYSFTPLFDNAGKVYGVMNTAAEVTDLNRAILKAEDSEHRYRTLIEESSVATALYLGRELKIRYANDIMLGYWGRDTSVIGKTLVEAVPELDGQPFLKMLDEVYQTGVPFTGDGTKATLLIDGELKDSYFNFTYKALRDGSGNIYGIHHIAQDVTAEVMIKQALEESENNLRNTILKAPVAMCIFRGTQHVIEIANDRMIEIWGARDNEVIGRSIFDALPDAKGQGFEAILKKVYESGESYSAQDVSVSLRRGAGVQEIYVTFVFEAYRAGEEITGIIAVANDVTPQVIARRKIEDIVAARTKELAEANQNLHKSNSELAQFAHIASHDLQEPIRKISVFSQMLQEQINAEDTKAQNLLSKIHTSSSRMITLIRDVLSYSELSKETDYFRQVNIGEIIAGIEHDFELLIEQKKATITYTDLPEIEAIPLQMSQLFGNLISNALKFSRKDLLPVITITSSVLKGAELAKYAVNDAKAGYYNIEFRDNGIGFEKEYAEQIFNIFRRLHGKAEYSGTGIGLAMCKKIANNHHGEIYATASDENGAVFNVILPAKQDPDRI